MLQINHVGYLLPNGSLKINYKLLPVTEIQQILCVSLDGDFCLNGFIVHAIANYYKRDFLLIQVTEIIFQREQKYHLGRKCEIQFIVPQLYIGFLCNNYSKFPLHDFNVLGCLFNISYHFI